MALNVREANAACRLILWARGHQVAEFGARVTDEDATEAARMLATAVNRAIHAGPQPGSIALRWTHTVRERLIQLESRPGASLSLAEREAVSAVLDVLDRIDRQAAMAAGTEA